ncbi:hypothetical protein [Falsiroseomonas tokyonensis]|uniref:Uncharacterized protein n=1 Tax=Falsiroseomonas tokyonensis TaxID=430521 RepID=A0ABV7BZQ8_9PROT|nr:hypothetical protein [Falsiroseomonas tokyonensis]MBU8539685.1 hypothetical protein [Falsiroseomonas tokyonensis]
MQEKPDAADLLATARDVVLQDLLPALPPDKAIAARMVAAAIALALRQATAPPMAEADLAALAAAIRAGRHDPGTESHAQVAAFLRDYARARAAVSAPKALG